MRNQFTTRTILAAVACAAGLGYAGPASAQNAGGDTGGYKAQELFAEDSSRGEGGVEIADSGTFDIHVKDLEISQVLQLLSIQAERNIVASRDVSGRVSADLFDVDFYEALDMVLLPNGFRWVEEGNFIKVISEEDWRAEQEASRTIVTRVHRLNYLRADEAAQFVEPMLSDNGTITASGNVGDGFQPDIGNGGSDTYSGPPTLVIHDYEDKVEEIVSTLQQLDVQPKMVIIEATVLSASLSEANAFGVDFALFTDLGALTSPLNVVDDLIGGGLNGGAVNPSGNTSLVGGQSTVGNTGAGDSGIKVGFASGDTAVFLRALDSVTDTTLIASPNITVLDRQRGDILIGEEVAYLSTTVTETSETQTVEFLEVGTQLTVRPFVSDDGKIRLELRPSVSDATIRTIGTTSAPDTETVELITNVIVDSGQTVVLGGLFTDDTSIDRSQVPGLGDMPFIGGAFQGQDDSVSRSEVIFLVKATVVESETLIEMGDQARAEVDVAGVAQRERLLPWSRAKLTSQHMINARQLFDQAMALPAGKDRDKMLAKSMYCIDMALHLDPSMLDALLLKQQISGEQIYIYHDSIVFRTLDTLVDDEMQAMDLPELDLGVQAEEAPADESGLAGFEAEAETTPPVADAATQEPGQVAQGDAGTEDEIASPVADAMTEDFNAAAHIEAKPAAAQPVADTAAQEPGSVDEVAELDPATEEAFEQADATEETETAEFADAGETSDLDNEAETETSETVADAAEEGVDSAEEVAESGENSPETGEDNATVGVDTEDLWEDFTWEDFELDSE